MSPKPVITMNEGGAFAMLVLGAHLIALVPLLSAFNSQAELRARCGEGTWYVVSALLLLVGFVLLVVGALGGGGSYYIYPMRLASGETSGTTSTGCTQINCNQWSASGSSAYCYSACEYNNLCEQAYCEEYVGLASETGFSCDIACTSSPAHSVPTPQPGPAAAPTSGTTCAQINCNQWSAAGSSAYCYSACEYNNLCQQAYCEDYVEISAESGYSCNIACSSSG